RHRARRRRGRGPGRRLCCRRHDRLRGEAGAPRHCVAGGPGVSEQPRSGAALEALADPAAELEEIEVDEPLVGIVMGSKSDLPAMEAAERELRERGIRCEVRVMSAHREPDKVADYARNARMRGLRVIIARAGLSPAPPATGAAPCDPPAIG